LPRAGPEDSLAKGGGPARGKEDLGGAGEIKTRSPFEQIRKGLRIIEEKVLGEGRDAVNPKKGEKRYLWSVVT